MSAIQPSPASAGFLLLARLSVLQFLVFAPLGSFLPLLTVHLKEQLHFSSFQIAAICATQALGALIALFVVGQIADRWLPADRCLTFCGLGSCGLLWALSSCTTPGAFFWLALLLWCVGAPTMALGAAICFAHLPNPTKEFGPVRVWGTVGWVVMGLMLGYWLSNPSWVVSLLQRWRPSAPGALLSDQFRLGSGMAFLLACYSLTLKRTPPRKHADHLLAPLKALSLLRMRPFAIFLFCHFGMCVTFPFSLQSTPLLLRELGVPRAQLSPVLTIAQSTEILALLCLQWILGFLGLRRTILTGLCAWTMALGVLMIGHPVYLVIASLSLHGIFICCVLVTGQVFVNSQASGDIRSSAQGLIAFSAGLGMLSGNLLVGWLREILHGQFPPLFAIATALAAMLVAIFAFGFHLKEE